MHRDHVADVSCARHRFSVPAATTMPLTSLKLALFLFLFCLSATRVASQKVTVVQVTTASLVLSWQKEGEWADVGTYQVNITADGYAFCEKTKECFYFGTCSFNTKEECGMFQPCSAVEVVVSGGGYTAPNLSVQTAPAGVTDLKVSDSAVTVRKEITWTNPTSSCFVETAVSVKYGGYYDYTLTPTGTSISVPLCNKGTGLVRVRAKGGDGESDAASATLARWTGNDTVAITSCPNEGCTDLTVEWDHNPVCSEVTQFEVIVGEGMNAVDTITDVTNTSATFEDLKFDTLYKTCVHALDKDDFLLASSCTTCGTYPEMPDELTVVNMTSTTVELEWEPPLCPVDASIEYRVSYQQSAGEVSATTKGTRFQCTDLLPAVNHTFCVLVQHPGVVPDHIPACTSSFTLPAAPESIEVRIYKTTSLYATWPGGIFTPNLKYLVSWGDNLEYSNYTEYKSYTIDGYNETLGPNKVCVQTETINPPGVISETTCQEQPFAIFGDDKPDNTAMIVSVSVSAGLAVLLSVVLLVVAKKEEKNMRDTT